MSTVLRNIVHAFAHWLGTNRTVQSVWIEGDDVFVGSECIGCGERTRALRLCKRHHVEIQA